MCAISIFLMIKLIQEPVTRIQLKINGQTESDQLRISLCDTQERIEYWDILLNKKKDDKFQVSVTEVRPRTVVTNQVQNPF